MAVVQGQGVRRRSGIAPNALVMAHSGLSEGEANYSTVCRVGRCKETFQQNGPDDLHPVMKMRVHEMLMHPRHSAGEQSRQVLKDIFNGGPR